MRLNRTNKKNDEDEKNNEEDEKEEKEVEEEEEEEDEEKGKSKIKQKQQNQKNKNKKKEKEKEEEEEEEEIEENQEENEYEDNHKKQMISDSKFEKIKGKKLIKFPNFQQAAEPYVDKNKTLLKILLSIVGVYISLLIIVNVVVAIVKRKKKKNMKVNFDNDEVRILNAMDTNRFSKLRDDLLISYCTEGILNLNKFYDENVEQKTYALPDTSLTNIHVSIGFSDACVDEIITHLSSLLDHMSSSSFLHIHIMDADNFTLETFTKVMNIVHKTNNHTELILYNANKARDDFKIKEGKGPSFNISYARLYAFTAIKDVQKIIMLNLENIMIEKDLADLYNIDMTDIYGRGISEVPSIRHPVEWMDPYVFDKSHFINGDVILINLELCQKDDFYNKAKELNNNNEFYTKTEEPAQDILNVLMRKKIEFFHPKFNKINFYENDEDKNDESKWYPWVAETMKYGEKNNHFYTKEDLLSADGEPFIVNYLWENQLNKKVKKYEEEKDKYEKINSLKK